MLSAEDFHFRPGLGVLTLCLGQRFGQRLHVVIRFNLSLPGRLLGQPHIVQTVQHGPLGQEIALDLTQLPQPRGRIQRRALG
jgi:hypothetical protein